MQVSYGGRTDDPATFETAVVLDTWPWGVLGPSDDGWVVLSQTELVTEEPAFTCVRPLDTRVTADDGMFDAWTLLQ